MIEFFVALWEELVRYSNNPIALVGVMGFYVLVGYMALWGVKQNPLILLFIGIPFLFAGIIAVLRGQPMMQVGIVAGALWCWRRGKKVAWGNMFPDMLYEWFDFRLRYARRRTHESAYQQTSYHRSSRKQQQDEAELHAQYQQAQAEVDAQARRAEEDIRRQRANAEETIRRKAEQLRYEREAFERAKRQQKSQRQSSQAPDPLNPKDFVDACKIFDLPSSSTLEQFKRRYKKLMAMYHPDRWASAGETHQKQAHQQAQLINAAWETIRRRRS